MRVLVGTSGYAYPEWRGSFYPPGLPAARMLAAYAARLDTVEINATFYRMPAPSTLAAWRAAVPERFVFALKAPQRITHVARLRDVAELVDLFCARARALGPRLGPILFQLPPALRRDDARLAELLGRVPPDLAVAVEFRHPSWFADAVYAQLRARNVALCVADTAAGTTPLVATADFGYLRLRAAGYGEADLARWAATLAARADAWRTAYVYFKHEASGAGPAFAMRLRRLLEEERP